MKVILQRAIGDCAIAAIATLAEQAYEDVFVEAAKVEPLYRGRSGLFLPHIKAICKNLKMEMKRKRHPNWEEDEGLLTVKWAKGSQHQVGASHLVALSYGVIADPADGIVLPADEYLAREKAKAGAFLEWIA